jgi:hypothetical protein
MIGCMVHLRVHGFQWMYILMDIMMFHLELSTHTLLLVKMGVVGVLYQHEYLVRSDRDGHEKQRQTLCSQDHVKLVSMCG